MSAGPPGAGNHRADVLVVGGGPAGLATATALARAGVPRVAVIEREAQAGGVPRHSDHLGYGVRDLHRLLAGPAYARALVDRASQAGAEVHVGASAVGWAGPLELDVAGAGGPARWSADAVVLATGCRERSRAARLVPGDRPAGVLTTGALQQLFTLHQQRLDGKRAVVVGAEHVSFSAVHTLHRAGARVDALVTPEPRHQSLGLLRLAVGRAGATLVPVIPDATIAEIRGRERLQSVVLSNGTVLACDVLVFTGDWVPDNELARLGGLAMDRGTLGPAVDVLLRTQQPGLFAVGNLVHAAEPADVCTKAGQAAAAGVQAWLRTGRWPALRAPLVAEPPLRWVSPSLAGPPRPGGRVLVHTAAWSTGTTRLSVVQDGRLLWCGVPHGHLIPNRSAWIPDRWMDQVDPSGGPVRVLLGDLR